MKAIVVTDEAAGTAGMTLVERPEPEAAGNDVVVQVHGRRRFAVTGDERTVVSDPHARYFGIELHGSELTPSDGARIGAISFDTWMAAQREATGR
jgi:hypothetical protein